MQHSFQNGAKIMPAGNILFGEKMRVSLLVFLAAIVRIFFLFKYEIMPGFAPGNVERALLILEDPSLKLNFDGGTSTLYKYALAGALYFWRDPVLAPRALTVLFGILLMVPYYGVIRLLFGRTAAFFSGLILVFYPLHVIQSSVTTSDAVYYFFLFTSFYYFFRSKDARARFSSLLLSALSFNVASLLRFESWILIPVLLLLLVPRNKRDASAFLILCLIGPGVSLLLNHVFQHDLFHSFSTAGRTSQASIAIGRFLRDTSPWSWLTLLWKTSGSSLVVGGILGIGAAFWMRQKRQLALFFLLFLGAFTANTMAGRMCAHARYSIILGLLLIPYMVFLGERGSLIFKGWGRAFIVLMLIFPGLDFARAVKSPHEAVQELFITVPSEVKDVGAWLKGNIRPEESIIIGADPADVWQNTILLYSGMASSKCLSVYTPLFGKSIFGDQETFMRYILNRRTKYLVLNLSGYLQKILQFDPALQRQRMDGVIFEAVFEREIPGSGRFIIYDISYPNA